MIINGLGDSFERIASQTSLVVEFALANQVTTKSKWKISIAWIGRLDRNAAQNLKIGALVNQLLVKINILLTYINCWQSPKIIK